MHSYFSTVLTCFSLVLLASCRAKSTGVNDIYGAASQAHPADAIDTDIGPSILPVQRLVKNGENVVQARLDVMEQDVDVGIRDRSGQPKMVRALTYNGSVPGPTIVANLNDTLELTVRNLSDSPTILHPHGFVLPFQYDGTHLSQPTITKNGEYLYRFKLIHAGTYWYHSHHDASNQMGRGLYGAIVVQDPGQPRVLRNLREKVIVISNVTTDGKAPHPHNIYERHVYVTNGKTLQSTTMRPGESQRYRIVNATTQQVVSLRPTKGATFLQIATDGGLTEHPYRPTVKQGGQQLNGVRLDAGERADIVITAPSDGSSAFEIMADPILSLPGKDDARARAAAVKDRLSDLLASIPPIYDPEVPQILMRVKVEGEPVQPILLSESTPLGEKIPDEFSFEATRDFELGMQGCLVDKDAYGFPAIFRYPLHVSVPVADAANSHIPVVERDEVSLERKSPYPPRLDQCKDLAVKNPAPTPSGLYPNIPKITEYLPSRSGEEKWVRHRWKNNSASMHPIHIHGYRFIVLSRNGQKEPVHGWKDTADLPPYGTLEYALKLEGYPGEWLYHCHFEVHMETGFMGSMVVHDPQSPETTPVALPMSGHMPHHN